MRKTAYIALGSNLGDREANLRDALEKLAALGEVTVVSPIYETEPMEFTRQPWFLNCAARLETEKMPRQLLRGLLAIERAMGRRRTAAASRPKGPRTLDLDILFFGRHVMRTPTLTIPHPALHVRRFVLAPLADIAPELVHPLLRRSVRDLLDALPPSAGEVRRIASPVHSPQPAPRTGL